jgi:hypothetical protein
LGLREKQKGRHKSQRYIEEERRAVVPWYY